MPDIEGAQGNFVCNLTPKMFDDGFWSVQFEQKNFWPESQV